MMRPNRFRTSLGQVDGLQPFVQRNVTRAENRTVRQGKSTSTGIALVGAEAR
jgi:hypothetical protein